MRTRRAVLFLALVLLWLTWPRSLHGPLPKLEVPEALAQYGYPYPYPPPAIGCCTRYGRCPLYGAQPFGTACYCPSPYGPLPGRAC